MNQERKPDCIIEQRNSDMKGIPEWNIHHDEFRPYFDTVAITKVYLRPEYKKQLEEEFQYFY